MENYKKYVHSHKVHNLNAANIVVPILMELFNPASVLDAGCGLGTWLYKFNELGVQDLLGLDSDYVDRKQLNRYLNKTQFREADLSCSFELNRKFDLVISLEVAEHLPPKSADGFIESLCRHGDTVVFSAAIPHQGGQHHINEQWKVYWVELFGKLNYKPYDIIRPRIWDQTTVDWWYRQNILVFSKNDLGRYNIFSDAIMDAVHPELFLHHVDYIIYLQNYVKELEEKLSK